MSNPVNVHNLIKSSHFEDSSVEIVTDDDIIDELDELFEEIVVDLPRYERPSKVLPVARPRLAVPPPPRIPPVSIEEIPNYRRKSTPKVAAAKLPDMTVRNAAVNPPVFDKPAETNRRSHWRLRRLAFFATLSLIVGGLVSLVVIAGNIHFGNRLTKLNGQITQAESTINRKVEGVGGQVTGVGKQVTDVGAQLKQTEEKILKEIGKNSHTNEEVTLLRAQNRQREQKIAALDREKADALEELARVRKQVENLNSLDKLGDSESSEEPRQNDDRFTHDHLLVDWVAGQIASVESSWKYGARGTAFIRGGKKDQAIGKYQILKSNVNSWTEEAIGKAFSIEDFEKDPMIQEKTAIFKIQQYVDKCRAEMIARRQAEAPKRILDCVARFWIAGPDGRKTEARDVVTGQSVSEYALEVVER